VRTRNSLITPFLSWINLLSGLMVFVRIYKFRRNIFFLRYFKFLEGEDWVIAAYMVYALLKFLLCCSVDTIKYLSLCLTGWSLRHEDVWESRCIDPHFLDFGVSWRWVVSYTPRSLYLRGKILGTLWIRDWVGPRISLLTMTFMGS
jgi:hypothetical protein